ncbi:MAG: hypothetical protein HY226_03065 [Candidatus Vogelbacteria bacterium]|nr:hypothetical protein [Candidatus Vogelbacteria bacterium]
METFTQKRETEKNLDNKKRLVRELDREYKSFRKIPVRLYASEHKILLERGNQILTEAEKFEGNVRMVFIDRSARPLAEFFRIRAKVRELRWDKPTKFPDISLHFIAGERSVSKFDDATKIKAEIFKQGTKWGAKEKVFVIDEFSDSGETLEAAKVRVQNAYPDADIYLKSIFAADITAAKKYGGLVDQYREGAPPSFYFHDSVVTKYKPDTFAEYSPEAPSNRAAFDRLLKEMKKIALEDYLPSDHESYEDRVKRLGFLK